MVTGDRGYIGTILVPILQKKSYDVIGYDSGYFSENLLEEINEEIQESFEHAGGEQFTYIPCLNDDDAHIKALSKIVEDNLAGWISPRT